MIFFSIFWRTDALNSLNYVVLASLPVFFEKFKMAAKMATIMEFVLKAI